MSLLKIINEIGFEMDDTPLMTEKSQFVPTREIASHMDYCYAIKFNRIPSKIYFEYQLPKFKDILSVLKEEGFKLQNIVSAMGRNDSMGYVFVHPEHIIVDIGNTRTRQSDVDLSVSDFTNHRTESVNVYFDVSRKHDVVFKLQETFGYVETVDDKGKILLFEKNEYGEMQLSPYPVKGYDLDVTENYNDDFLEVHAKIQEWIPNFKSQNNKLVLFNGEPGTGKTNYLKYLLNNTPDVKKIYIPPYFVQSIADPAFFPIIKREKESLLIIEDAEKILVNREDQSDNSTISILLNLCDGIMADVLNFKIIATFNTDEDKIDAALKRKGRMFLKYKFDKLANDKAAKLYEKVHGEELNSNDPMTLAEIYNDENNFGKKKQERKIGFA